MGRKRLTSSFGTGKKVLENLNLFKFNLKERDDTLYLFNVNFDGTEGGISIRLNDRNEVETICLNMKNFKKSLLEYNDPTLKQLAEFMISQLNRNIK